MLLLLHISIALTSIASSCFSLAKPSSAKLRATYALIAATFASGTLLVIIQPAHLASACLSGLSYLAIVSILAAMAQRKLARESEHLL